MTASRKLLAGVASLLMVLSVFAGTVVLPAGMASADEAEPLQPGPITEPGVIEVPGVYTLQNDIDLGGQNITAFEIKASDVVLDGNGYTISNGESEAIHVLASSSGNALTNVTVKNLRITDVETGISTMNLQDGAFVDLELVSNADAGLVFAGTSNTNNLVDNVLFEDNEKGIFLRQGTAGMTIQNSDFIQNHEVAIKASGSSDNEILNSLFDGQDGEKTIHLTGRSPGHLIQGNEIYNSNGPENAIQVGGEATETIIEENTIAHNSGGAISLGPVDNVVRNNEIFDNLYGISVGASGNTIEGNLIYENGDGIELLGSGNAVSENTVKNNVGWDVYALEGATNNVVSNLVIDDAGTTVTVTGDAVDFGLKGAAAPTPPAPDGYTALDKYVEVEPTTLTGVVDVQLHYTAKDFSGISENDLTVARFDGTEWTGVPDAGVDTGNDYVYATTSEAGVLGAVAGTGDIVDPVADAGPDKTVLANEPVTFDGSGSTDDIGIDSYEWEFGDDTTATGVTPTHAYDTAGTYTVTLTVADAAGNTDTDTLTVEVLGEDTTDPVADAGPDHYGLIGATFDFDASGSTDNVGIASYAWDFDGDGTTDSTNESDSYTYATADTYEVTLTVTDTSGNVGTDTATVTIIESDTQAPVADAGEDRTVEVATPVTFDGSGSTDDIGIDSYAWDLDGDGTVDDTGETVTYTYSTEGTYTATLTVADAAGNTDTDTAVITVAEHVDEEVLEPGDIATCGVIETEGVYTLTTDLRASEEGVTTCFEIKASNVTLDGNGYTVYGDVEGAAEGIHVLGVGSAPALTNVTITDLTLTQWDSAISAKNVRDSTFENIGFTSNLDKGIAISGSDSTNNVVTGSTFTDNEKGIFLERGADHTLIQGNTFDANHEVGVKTSGAPFTEVRNNVFTAHDGEKVIHFTGESPNAIIQGNRILDSSGPENAIQLGGESGDSLVADNIVTGGTLGGISAGPYNVDVVNNTVYDNDDIGITIGDGGGEVSDNLVYGNRIGLVFDASTGVTGTDNVVLNNAEWDVVALDGATDNTVSNLVIDDVGTTIDVNPASVDYAIEGGVDFTATLPGDYVSEGEDFDVNITSDVGLLDLTVYYDSVSNTTGLKLVRYDEATGWWLGIPTAVDTGAKSLTATVEEPGIVMPASGTTDITPPQAVATADPSYVAVDETVTFDGSGSTDGGEIVSYEWEFGDGTNATGATVTHEYAEGGVYTATLTVTDDAGYSDTATVDVGVDAEDPVAEAGADIVVQPAVEATFDGSGSTDDVGIETFAWDFGDETPAATGETVTHAYTMPGEYTATLTVTDYLGNTDTDTLTVTVDDESPTPDAGQQNRYGRTNEVLTFDASASTDNVGIDSYVWNFGDGTTATGATATHAYDAEGTYTVTLTVVDLAGNLASTTVQVTIEDPVAPPGDDDGPSGGGSSGGAAGSSGGGGAAPPADPLSVDVEYPDPARAHVSVKNAGADTKLRVQFAFQRQANECHVLEEVRFWARNAGDHEMTVESMTQARSGMPVFEGEGVDAPFGYYVVGHSHTEEEYTRAVFQFRVAKQCLEQRGLTPNDVVMYRYANGEWTPLETQMFAQTETEYRYQAQSPGLSVLAIGTVPGQQATPTETPEPTPTPEPPTETPEEPAETPTSEEPSSTPTDSGGPGFGLIAALVALLGAALWVVRRRER